MKPSHGRLALVAAIFLAWLAYIGWQVLTRPVTASGRPLAVSRPQILSSEIDIIADISDPEGDVVVEEVLWPAEGALLKKGDRVKVAFLADCRPLGRGGDDDPPADYSGPGRYLLPLRRAGVTYEVAPVPFSPGFRTPQLSAPAEPGTAVLTPSGAAGRVLPPAKGDVAPSRVRVQLTGGSIEEHFVNELHRLPARIYPATAETRAQYGRAGKPE